MSALPAVARARLDGLPLLRPPGPQRAGGRRGRTGPRDVCPAASHLRAWGQAGVATRVAHGLLRVSMAAKSPSARVPHHSLPVAPGNRPPDLAWRARATEPGH